MSDDALFPDDGPTLPPGPCCACRRTGAPLRNIVMLPVKAPMAGSGWGCAVCSLPPDGCLAVVCDNCLEAGAEIRDVCHGYAESGGRTARALCTEPFDHDPVCHGDERHWPQDAWDDDEETEMETFVCAVCGDVVPRPAIVLFSGEGETMTATELCLVCIGASS